ncbi:hypothetical protein ACX8XP_06300 [Calditrichota bacterium LG25]
MDYNQVLRLGDQMESQYKKVEDNEKMRNYFYMATVSVWLINVLDAMIMTPGWKSSVKFSLNNGAKGVEIHFVIR